MFFYLSTRVCVVTICLPFSEQQQRLGSPQIGKLLSENFSFTVLTYKHTYTLHTVTHTHMQPHINLPATKTQNRYCNSTGSALQSLSPCPFASGSHFSLVLWFVQLFLKVSPFDRRSCFPIVWFLLSINLIRANPPKTWEQKTTSTTHASNQHDDDEGQQHAAAAACLIKP